MNMMEKRQARGKEDGVGPCWGRVKDNSIDIVKTSLIIPYKDGNKMVQSVFFQVKKNHVFQTIIFKESSKQKLHSCRRISRIHLCFFSVL